MAVIALSNLVQILLRHATDRDIWMWNYMLLMCAYGIFFNNKYLKCWPKESKSFCQISTKCKNTDISSSVRKYLNIFFYNTFPFPHWGAHRRWDLHLLNRKKNTYKKTQPINLETLVCLYCVTSHHSHRVKPYI